MPLSNVRFLAAVNAAGLSNDATPFVLAALIEGYSASKTYTPSTLAKKLKMPVSTCSRAIAALAEGGFVKYEASVSDRRVKWLHVTPRAVKRFGG